MIRSFIFLQSCRRNTVENFQNNPEVVFVFFVERFFRNRFFFWEIGKWQVIRRWIGIHRGPVSHDPCIALFGKPPWWLTSRRKQGASRGLLSQVEKGEFYGPSWLNDATEREDKRSRPIGRGLLSQRKRNNGKELYWIFGEAIAKQWCDEYTWRGLLSLF